MIFYDPRWAGPHGIGRFAAAVTGRIAAVPLKVSGNPAAPLDSILLSKALKRVSAGSVFFSPGYNAPLFSKVPFVFTVHDLNHIDRPENSSPAKQLYYATFLKNACHRAARVLTVSGYFSQRIAEWAGLPAAQVLNVGNGVDPTFHGGVEPHAPGYPYLLCVSNRRLHKNEGRALDAFSIAALSSETKLIFSGRSTPLLEAAADKRGVRDRVVFAGEISEAALPSYYKGALALLFPSLYEGFGLPVLEAMACGTPVITSNTTALPEVAGNAALLVDPESVEEIAHAIERTFDDSELRTEMISRGYRQAAKFSWEATSRKVLEALRTAGGDLFGP